MPVRIQHDQLPNSVYYITFTCYKWKHLFSISQAYDAVYKWFDKLSEKKISVFSYVIMPNPCCRQAGFSCHLAFSRNAHVIKYNHR